MKTVSPRWSHEVLSNWFRQRPETLETELLHEFFPSDEGWTGLTLELFEKHFLLYRRLYQFDDELRLTCGDRLWIRNIRIALKKAPEPGLCRHFDEEEGTFCARGTANLEPICSIHRTTEAETKDPLELVGIKGYYMDWRNLETMSQERLESMVEQFFQQVFEPEKLNTSLTLFGLDSRFTQEQLRKRWRELSLELHPDHGGDVERYQRLVEAYSVLKQVRS